MVCRRQSFKGTVHACVRNFLTDLHPWGLIPFPLHGLQGPCGCAAGGAEAGAGLWRGAHSHRELWAVFWAAELVILRRDSQPAAGVSLSNLMAICGI